MPHWKTLIPTPVKRGLWELRALGRAARHARFVRTETRRLMRKHGLDNPKYAAEVDYWQGRCDAEGGRLQNEHFRKRFLAMAGESDDSFCRGKIVADFGCGPRGSLCWATRAKARIGIDVLADAYSRFGIARQNMTYVCSSEDRIPLPSDYVDVLFTLNAIDHVDNFETQCRELLRILRSGGSFIGSFNLDEPVSVCEPQSLSEEMIDRHLLRHLRVQSYRIAPKGPDKDCYRYFFKPPPPNRAGPRILWVRTKLVDRDPTRAAELERAGTQRRMATIGGSQ